LDGEITQELKEVADYIGQGGCKVIPTPNLASIRWTKLLINAALSGMSATIGDYMCNVVRDDKGALCAVHTGNEVVQLAKAQEIELVELYQGFDFNEMGFSDAAGRERALAFARRFWGESYVKASMLNDMLRGIPCEIDFINGAVAERGDRLGIETPFNDTIVDIIKQFEAGEAPFPTIEANLPKFNIPGL
jgi:2-dehydropantoate 2-reductase